MTDPMTEPSEAAMKVWREAMMAYHAADTSTMAEDIAIADEAAALVIDRAMVAGEPVAAPDTAPDVAELVELVRELALCRLTGADGKPLETGWNITRLNTLRPRLVALLARLGRVEG